MSLDNVMQLTTLHIIINDSSRTLQKIIGLIARYCLDIVNLTLVKQTNEQFLLNIDIRHNNIHKTNNLVKKLESFIDLQIIKQI